MAEMICPICGREFDGIDIAFLDNGNPVCFECAQKEEMQKEEK